ncbi:MAG: ribosome biogenesis GTPase Der [Desulfuromonadia bacterium]
MKPVVAIVGRPNVGKSTLFNRLIGTRKAIVDDTPGVTRDRNYGTVIRGEIPFILIDTGGFEPVTDDRLLQQMREQSQLAIEEADLIIFLMDGKSGLTPADREIAAMLRRSAKPLLYVVNKVDGEKLELASSDFYSLGVESLLTVSAAHNRGISDLLSAITDRLPVRGGDADLDLVARIAVVGRPNVGKSSLVNRLLGYERSVANPTPGTTRDSIDTIFTWHRKKFLLIDTAGIRRKGKTTHKLEKYSVVDALRSISRADIVLIVLNAAEGVTEQDARIAGHAYEEGKGCIFVVNKWDIPKKDDRTVGTFVQTIRDEFKYLSFAPILFVSALTGQRINRVMESVAAVCEQYSRRVSTADLNRVFKDAVAIHHAPLASGRRVKFYYATQVGTKPPTFVIFTNAPEGIHFSYERYLTNRFREAFGFEGTPLRLIFRGREEALGKRRRG